MQIHRQQRQQQRDKIRQIVSGFRQQGQRMRTDSRNYQQNNVSRSYREGYPQDPRCPLIPAWVDMHVHLSSLRSAGKGFKTAALGYWFLVLGSSSGLLVSRELGSSFYASQQTPTHNDSPKTSGQEPRADSQGPPFEPS